jgi:4-hydroxy-2-oxoheptanedioate aldolase
LPGLLNQLQAMKSGHASQVVRVAWNDPVLIKPVLDIGVTSVLSPSLRTRGKPTGQSRRAGIHRSVSVELPVPGEQASTARNLTIFKKQTTICILVQIESMAALREIDNIARIKGVDGVFVGPSDLAASMGHIGNPSHQDVQAAVQTAGRRLADLGMPAGILSGTEESVRRYIEWGYRFVAAGSDVGLMANGSSRLVANFAEA